MNYQRIVVSQYGGPEVLQLAEADIPEPRFGEVRIKVLAAGVGMPDIMAREGIHPETPRVPYTPGWDLVGVVDALGSGVRGIEVGQRVAAMPISGAYAEYVCLKSRELVAVPHDVDSAEAVSVVLNYITAYQMLHYCAQAKPGQSILIQGASGGRGHQNCGETFVWVLKWSYTNFPTFRQCRFPGCLWRECQTKCRKIWRRRLVWNFFDVLMANINLLRLVELTTITHPFGFASGREYRAMPSCYFHQFRTISTDNKEPSNGELHLHSHRRFRSHLLRQAVCSTQRNGDH